MLAFDCVCFSEFVADFRMGLGEIASPRFGGWKTLLIGRRDEQLGMGVFLILEYQKSFRRPYPAAHPFLYKEDV
jgi:hypothetical protein